MRFWALAAVLAICFVQPVNSQGIWVSTNWTCADWAKSRSNGTSFPIEQFFNGMLDGLAVASRQDLWRSPYTIETKQAHYWLDRYCEREPLNNVVSGALALATERLGEGWNQQ